MLVRGRWRVAFAGRDYTGERRLSERERAAFERQLSARLRLAERERGPLTGVRLAARVAGILSALRRGAVGNRAFGYALHAHHGAKVKRMHGWRRLSRPTILDVGAPLVRQPEA